MSLYKLSKLTGMRKRHMRYILRKNLSALPLHSLGFRNFTHIGSFPSGDHAMFEKYRPRIIIADDHTLIAEACKQLLETEFEVVAVVNNGQALIDSVCRLNPDVALVDISMPLLNGLDACEHIRGIKRTVKIIFLTMNADRAMAAEAFRRGASGFLPKTAASAELPVAIRTVLKGKPYISPLIGGDSFELRVEFEGTN